MESALVVPLWEDAIGNHIRRTLKVWKEKLVGILSRLVNWTEIGFIMQSLSGTCYIH